MSMEIFYEDLMDNFDNNNLREKIMQLVHDHNIIVVRGLNSSQRHIIYRQMYYPLKFEKIINEDDNKNIDVRIYNYKIKNSKEENKNKTNDKKNKETKNEDEFVLQEESEEENDDSSQCVSELDKSEELDESDDSYFTDEEEQLTRLEDIGSQILEKAVNNEKKIDRTANRVNLVILFNIIGWITLYLLDPVRIINIRTVECEMI